MAFSSGFCCGGHLFFEDIDIPQEQKDFFDCVFMIEGDIFEFMFDWVLMEELILKEIFEIESFNIRGCAGPGGF